MGYIFFVYDYQIFNPTDFFAYAVKENEDEYYLGVVDRELFVDDKYLDGSFSLKLYSKGVKGPTFFSSQLLENEYYRINYNAKRVFIDDNPFYFLI